MIQPENINHDKYSRKLLIPKESRLKDRRPNAAIAHICLGLENVLKILNHPFFLFDPGEVAFQ